jgi:hypothetical protein
MESAVQPHSFTDIRFRFKLTNFSFAHRPALQHQALDQGCEELPLALCVDGAQMRLGRNVQSDRLSDRLREIQRSPENP